MDVAACYGRDRVRAGWWAGLAGQASTQPVDQDLRGHVIDVDQAAVIELARQLRVADAQLVGQRDITGRDRPGLLAPLSGGKRSGDRWRRGREYAAAQHKRMSRPDDHERKGRGSKQHVAPAAHGGRRSDEPSHRADGIGGRDCPQPPLLEPDRRMGEGDGRQQAE
jgi:hypothetical protein